MGYVRVVRRKTLKNQDERQTIPTYSITRSGLYICTATPPLQPRFCAFNMLRGETSGFRISAMGALQDLQEHGDSKGHAFICVRGQVRGKSIRMVSRIWDQVKK